ncbi:hypothetical protein CFBP4996_18185 [Agrobacterium leguminum]|uniref:DUF1441 family protein n=2 Tax=Agrobacterium TaxID=357 RepID=A0A9X3KC81_9HYPH|nr:MULTISPECIES: hypothetical protein [Agrobacterium]MCZ7909374.1 hypothetical protein [Agrobacterium leguminum]WFS67954.1 hypothetical protein CFBP4996_18185 [Agrobacterium leguminum]
MPFMTGRGQAAEGTHPRVKGPYRDFSPCGPGRPRKAASQTVEKFGLTGLTALTHGLTNGLTMSDVMWSVAQIAARDGVSKAAVSKTVKKLSEDRPDTPINRGAQGQVLAVSLAHYDHYRQRFVNPAKASAPLRLPEDPAAPRSDAEFPMRNEDSFEEAKRQNEWLKLGREKIRHQEDCDELLRKDRVIAGVVKAGGEIQAIIKRLPNRADALALAVSKEGVHGVRSLLRQIAFEMSNEVADKLEQIAERSPESDPLIEDEDA